MLLHELQSIGIDHLGGTLALLIELADALRRTLRVYARRYLGYEIVGIHRTLGRHQHLTVGIEHHIGGIGTHLKRAG